MLSEATVIKLIISAMHTVREMTQSKCVKNNYTSDYNLNAILQLDYKEK